jgi:hypothetical protein
MKGIMQKPVCMVEMVIEETGVLPNGVLPDGSLRHIGLARAHFCTGPLHRRIEGATDRRGQRIDLFKTQN